jgi:hypothetical protein
MSDEPILGPNRGNAGKGRPKGSTNRIGREIKEMVAQALDEAHPEGGVEYLKLQAATNPTAFLTLVGKVIPLQVAGNMNHAVKVSGALAWKPQQ